jgi:lipoate-protein ligase A
MRLLDRTLATAAENLALDEALLLQAEAGDAGEVLRLWEWPEPAVVLGSGCKLRDDVDPDACLADRVPVLRRSSGGGTVLFGRGCLCFSLVLAFDRDPRLGDVRSSYEHILGRVVEAFALPGLALSGISDLAIHGYKFSGNAQQRKRTHLLHHGTILYDFDLAAVSRYLRQPARQPDYRADRPHGDFLRNLGRPRRWVVDRLRQAWGADEERQDVPGDVVARLVSEKYALREWTERR